MDGIKNLLIAIQLEACLVVAGIGPDISQEEITVAKNFCREVLNIEPNDEFKDYVRSVIHVARGERRKYYKGLRRSPERNAAGGAKKMHKVRKRKAARGIFTRQESHGREGVEMQGVR
jgi:hypothetical protein